MPSLQRKVVISGSITAMAAVFLPLPASASPYCDPHYARSYAKGSFAFTNYDSGTIYNSSGATVTKSYTHSESHSITSTVSAAMTVGVKTLIAEANATVSAGVAYTASYTNSTTFTVSAPPYTNVEYKDGVGVRSITVKEYYIYSNCNTGTPKYATLRGADNVSEVRNS